MKNYKAFLKRVMEKYHCSKKCAQNGLNQAYMTYLSIDELEPFIIEQKKEDSNKNAKNFKRICTRI